MNFAIPAESLVIGLSTDRPAIYSGKKLSRLIDSVAGKLHNLHLPPDAGIGIIGVNSVPYIIAMLGTHKTNHVCVPLNYKLPEDKIHFCLNESKVGLVFCDAKFKHLVPAGIITIEFDSDFDQFVDNDYLPPEDLDLNRVTLALYTSGSTGAPKKVLFSFQDRFSETAMKKMLLWNSVKHRTMSANPLFHIAGINWLVINLVRGNVLFVLSHFDASEFLKHIQKNRITSLTLVPPMMSMMLNETELLKTTDLSLVKEIVFQAGLVDVSLLEQVKQVFVNVEHIANSYGSTETGFGVFGKHPDGRKTPPGSVGYPLPLVKTKLIDDVLFVNTKDLTSRLQEVGEEYFDTRDRFRVDEHGFYYYAGRVDDMLKCGGEKVYPIEIEQVLTQHPAVVESVIIGLDDEIKGQKPYAFVKLSTPVEETHLIDYVSSMLATYQIPKRIWSVDTFPINEIGKIDKKTLVQLAQQYISNNMNFNPPDNLKGQTAVITGAMGKVGYATAQRLADCGARIIGLVRRDVEAAQQRLNQLPNNALNHLALLADVTDTASLKLAASQVDRCDILVNCAGYTKMIRNSELHELTDEMFHKIVSVNLHGTYATIREFGNLLKASGDGLIVNITSAAGLRASTSNVAYGASKAGVDLLTKSLAVSLAPTVRVISIAPGYLQDGVSGTTVTPDGRARMISITPMNRVGTAKEVADAILAYATVIKFTTGAIVVLDGGRTL